MSIKKAHKVRFPQSRSIDGPQHLIKKVDGRFVVVVASISPLTGLRTFRRPEVICGRENEFATEQQAEAFFRRHICDKKDR